jgi:hypothetical protein
MATIMTAKVDWGDGSHVVPVNNWTIIQWERKTKQKYSKVRELGMGLDDITLMAWIACRDQGITVPEYDRFCRLTGEVGDIDIVEDPDAENPTSAVPGDTP